MPKGNPGRLKSRFEIRGELSPNEYEFQQHQGEMSEQEHENLPPAKGQEGTPEALMSPQQREAARIGEIEERAHRIVEGRRAKRGRSEAKGGAKGGARKAAKKSASRKSAATKGRAVGQARATSGAKKSASKQNAAKQVANVKTAGKASAKKSGKQGTAKSTKAGAGKKGAKRR